MRRFSFFLLVFALAIPTLLPAQNVARGSIGGTIYDSSGGVLPDAWLTLASEFVRKMRSGPEATFLSLEPGRYTLKAEYSGFKLTLIKNIVVRLNERTTLRVKLEPGDVAQTITVMAAPLGIDPTSTSSGGTISSELFQNTPVARNATDLPYLVAGVSDGLGTGRANPSISGASGLENLYIVDGVDIGNPGYGGVGTYSAIYGSVGSGIQFDFLKEVQVKTAGFEAQYGQALGGVVNMITKSGGNAYHGGAYIYAAPSFLELTRLQPNAVRFNKGQETLGLSTYDAGAELGGYFLKDRLFWYGGIDAAFYLSEDAGPANFRSAALGSGIIETSSLNYSAKITYNLTANQNHQIEASVFGDPSHQPFGPNRQSNGRGAGALVSDFPERSFSELDYGSRNFTVRYSGAFTPSWLANASFSWAHNQFIESNLPNIYRIQDRTEATIGVPNPLLDGLPTPTTTRGLNEIGGAGFVENTRSNSKQFSINVTHTFRRWGAHQWDVGGEYQDVDYDWFHRRTGPDWKLPCTDFLGRSVIGGDSDLGKEFSPPDCGKTVFGADGLLRNDAQHTAANPSGYFFYLRRGAFTGRQGTTNSKYAALYFQDTWQLRKFLTLKLGIRWEQQRIAGLDAHYSFTGNWAPRLSIIVDPWSNRRTKIFASAGRFFEKIPQDLAVRALSDESQYLGVRFGLTNPSAPISGSYSAFNSMLHPTPGCPASTPDTPEGINSCLTNPVNYILDAAHHVFINAASGSVGFTGGTTQFAPGTKAQYQDELVVGIEHEFRGGIFASARYLDRRLRRIVEDISGETVGAFVAGTASDDSRIVQHFLLANPNSHTDLFHNTRCDPRPPGFGYEGGVVPDPFNENPGTALGCLDVMSNPQYLAGSASLGPDGVPDGFPDPVRRYQAIEVQVEKRFAQNWQLMGNWRIAKLVGNYEGLFRNDNGQDDPNITSLFDFVGSSSLGDQFTPGPLPTDRRHIANVYASYMFNRGINVGVGWRFQTGVPLSILAAHPAYLNPGEVPMDGRGAAGRSPATTNLDAHADYTWKLTERFRAKFVVDIFNILNLRRVQRVDQNFDTGFLAGVLPTRQPNLDFLKPTSANNAYQRPLNVRLAARIEF